jgi:dienelactone hydrolase
MRFRPVFLLVVFWPMCAAAGVVAADYDPLTIPEDYETETLDLTIENGPSGRDLPIRLYLPSERDPAAVVLFSHGLGGSREGGRYLGRHWSARGYVAVFIQHPGSDTSVWKDAPPAQRMAAMKKAANVRNFMLRIRDVKAVLDQLGCWNRMDDHPLCGRLEPNHVGMSGHSFGARTTQAVSGQKFGRRGVSLADRRIDAAIVFSPSSPRRGSPREAFGRVEIPWMLMTGTKDLAVIGHADMESRLSVFPALPTGDKYELVLHNAEHSAFTDRALPGDSESRNPNHHRVICALTTAFWDAYLCGDPAAKTWLNGDGPCSVLESKDRWQRK